MAYAPMHRMMLLVAVLGVIQDTRADTIHVPDDFPTIMEAIGSAVDGDEIIAAPGTYFERINFKGKAITLRSSDGPEVTTIDGNGSATVVTCNRDEGPDTILEGFTITGSDWHSTGGGMLNSDSSPTVINCVFAGNVAGRGGGMYNSGGSPMIIDCDFDDNFAMEEGGGMYNVDASPTVINCTFQGNAAGHGGNAGQHGGEEAGPVAGGGMYNSGGSPTVFNCTFQDNETGAKFRAGLGGGICNVDSANTLIVNCVFEGNVARVFAAAGGGVYNSGASVTVVNCVFAHNGAHSGGGLYNGADAFVVNSTFTRNIANGIRTAVDATTTVSNCILWSNAFNSLSGVPLVTYSDVQGGFAGMGNIDADPLFIHPDNGDYRLSPGSPCIDAGDNTAVPRDITTDLDGNPRFVDDADTKDTGNGRRPIVDMGAYEYQGR